MWVHLSVLLHSFLFNIFYVILDEQDKLEKEILDKYKLKHSESILKPGSLRADLRQAKSLDRKAHRRLQRPESPSLSVFSGAGASLSSPEVTRTSRQQENRQLQGLNTRLAGLIDKVTIREMLRSFENLPYR